VLHDVDDRVYEIKKPLSNQRLFLILVETAGNSTIWDTAKNLSIPVLLSFDVRYGLIIMGHHYGIDCNKPDQIQAVLSLKPEDCSLIKCLL